MVKCSYDDCIKPGRHEMIVKYLRCDCKQSACNLRYQYRHCESVDEWQLFREGNNPRLGQRFNKRGVPLQIIKLIEEILQIDPELKPKAVHQAIVAERKANQILEKDNKAKK